MPSVSRDVISRCQQCDVTLTGQAVAGLCVNCLLKLALDPPDEQAGMANAPDPAAADPTQVSCCGDFEPGHGSDHGTAAPREAAGSRIGRYRLLKQIGEGGFGVVWMAGQLEPVTRRVALKIIKMGMDTREVIARFEAERQALAMMDHPNIARVLDAGATDSGRPYFVMELVNGIPITKFCDEQKFGTRERLELFAEVCSAINHAHQKGVIHRDIKPSNVMVTLDGNKAVPKVIDFGIAKATQGRLTDGTLFTRFDQFVGTPVYMSPEQAGLGGLDVDTRCDIYALGILLYELLTGKPPFDAKSLASAGYDEMRRIIREMEPPKPSSRLSTIAGEERTTMANARHIEPGKFSRMVEPDLDWIVMKAIEKDRTRRYETVNGLALDIRRFLSDEPVSAGPPGVRYRFRKFVRRHRTALRVSAAIAAMLITATVISTRHLARATTLEEELAARKLADSVSISRRLDAEVISSFFLEEIFQSLASPAGRSSTVAEMLGRTESYLDINFSDQPERRALFQGILGRRYHSVGFYPEAIPLLETSRDFFLAARGREHPDTLAAMHDLANAWYSVGRRPEALALHGEVLELRRRILGPDHRDTLAAMSSLADSLHADGQLQKALGMQEEVVTRSRNALGLEDPDTLAAIHDVALAHHWSGGLPADELQAEEQALAASGKTRGEKHPVTLSRMHDMAHFLNDAGRTAEVLPLREAEHKLRREVNPYHPDTLHCGADLAKSWHDEGRRDEALQLQKQVVEDYRTKLGPAHPQMLLEAGNLAYFQLWTGRRDGALPLLEELMVAPSRTSMLSLKLTTLLVWLGKNTEHNEVCRRVFLEAAVTQSASTVERAAKGFCLLPSTDQGLLADALIMGRRAVALGKSEPEPQWFYLALGMAEYRNGHYTDADKSLIAAEQAGPNEPLIQGPARLFHAMSLFRQGHGPEARKLFDAAIAQMDPLPVEGQPFKKRSDHDDLIFWMAYKEARALLR